jgi:ubiquinone/menaquinone biosynthesis C-methylase UbiE
VTPEHPWLAALLDVMMRPLEPARRLVVPEAHGIVLEIGVGTGLNLEFYDAQRVERLVAIEPDPHMLRRARPRVAALPFPATLVQADAERLPFSPATFDTIVITFTLCTIPHPARALAEIRRAIRPGGHVLVLEHTRSPQPTLATIQDAVTPLWRRIAGGCHLNRPAVDLLRESGFEPRDVTPIWRERWTLLPVYRTVAHPVRREQV